MNIYLDLSTLESSGSSGESGALDNIDGAGLLDGDRAFVFTSTDKLYIYRLDADYGDVADSSPNTIKPLVNHGSKMWILISIYISTMSVTTLYFGDSDTNGSWKLEVDGNDLKAYRRESATWIEKGGFFA